MTEQVRFSFITLTHSLRMRNSRVKNEITYLRGTLTNVSNLSRQKLKGKKKKQYHEDLNLSAQMLLSTY